MDIAQITQYFNIGLLVLFLLVALGIFLSGLRGFLRGIWKSTHNMVFMLSLVFIAFFTLTILTDFIGSFNISMFFKGSLAVSRQIDGSTVTYYVPITSVKETLTEFIKAFYTLFNVSASPASAANFALALTGSVLKIIVFVVEMLLIVTLGNLFSFITWYLIFQHFIPRVARKLVKLRWVGMIETAVTFVVVTFLFFTPFTSLVNSINQSYQNHRPKSDNEMIVNVGNFVDAYNDSLFAKILFNWTVDGSGMTLDTRLFDTLTTSVSGEYSIGLVGEFVNITNIIMTAGDGFTSGGSGYDYDPTALVTKDVIDLAFDSIINSDLITSVIPVVVDIAMNSDVLEDYIPNRLVDLSDVEWDKEIGYVKDMVDCIFDSGIIDRLFVTDENGNKKMRSFEGNDVYNFINEIVYSEDFYTVLDIFKSIDQSKVLSRAVPAAIQFAMNNDKDGNIQKYLPLSWDELNELSWGYETYILFDFLHSTVALDDDFLKAIFIKAGLYKPEEGENIKALQTLIAENADEFRELLVGEFNSAGELINVDETGRTEVFENGERIIDENGEKRNYCLFDMTLIGKTLPTLLDGLFEADFFKDFMKNLTEEDIEPFHEAVEALNTGTRLINYKKEFNAVLDIVTTVAKDEELLDALFNSGNLNSLMKEEGNFFSIEQKHINYFQQAIGKMDRSSIIYSVLTPIFKSLLSGNDIVNTLNDIGLRADVLVSAINHDVKRTNHRFFTELSSIFDSWSDLNIVYSLTSAGGDTNALMDKLKDDETIDAFTNILKTLHNNEIINPTPEAGDTYEKNENLYGLLEYVFSMTSSMGLTITRDTLRKVESPGHTWDDEFDALGDILQFIAEKDIMNASSDLGTNLSRSTIAKLRDKGEGNYDIPGLFTKIDGSYIFSSTLGPFLDQTFGDSLNGFLTDKDNHVTFENITDWAEEGTSIKNLLNTIYYILPEDDAEAANFFSNFDIKSLDKIVDLNALLHDLAHSGIFTYIDENDNSHYQFGLWLYDKIDSSMSSFKDYDLLADPVIGGDAVYSTAETWGSWGTRPEDDLETADPYFLEWKNKYNASGSLESTHYIAYKDFAFVNGMANDDPAVAAFWCDYHTFQTKQEAFLTEHRDDLTDDTYLDNPWGAYFASDTFMNDYDDVFDVDEISRVTRFLSYAMRIIEPKTDSSTLSFTDIPAPLLGSMLDSINETSCMRIAIYNFYRIAAGSVFNTYSAFSLDSAYSAYMVSNDVGMYDFTSARPLRSAELDKLVELYRVINKAKEKGVVNPDNSFNYGAMNDSAFMDELEGAIKGLNDSFVFHRKGSSKAGQLTVFQGMFNSMLKESDIKNMIYLDHSPKDQNATAYDDSLTKIRYLVETSFRPDKEINTYIQELDDGTTFDDVRNSEQDEIHSLLGSINKIYSLKDTGGNPVTSLENADMNNPANSAIIHELLQTLNESNLLCDLVPNTIYNLFIENDKFDISSGTESVDFSRADPFYHYYYNETLVKRASPDFNARYLSDDIDGIYYLLEDYQEFNSLVGGGDFANRTILKTISGVKVGGSFVANGVLPRMLKHLKACNIFHTPARDNAYAIYYTDKFDGDGFTLFEETISKVCSFVGLDVFAFDEDYDPTLGLGYDTAPKKMAKLITAMTKADDTGSSTTYYHKAKGQAWNEEIDAIMHLAYCSADVGTGPTLDTSAIDLSTMPPEQLETLLTVLNYSDLSSDALPIMVKKGFEAINLGSQTTYNAVNYAYYRLGQGVYGGPLGNAPKGSEIDNIVGVMESLATKDGSGNFNGYCTTMNDMNDFIKGEGGSSGGKGLEGLLKYLYDSHIFNTSLAGNYNEYNLVSGRKISAQGVLLYNSFNTEESRYILSYIARDADASTSEASAIDKIAVFSKILHMKGNYFHPVTEEDITYSVEASGLRKLIDLTDGSLSGSTFSSDTSIENVESHRALITGTIECSYNADDEGRRSCLVSEIVSGVFNNILENQYTKLVDERPTYQFEVFSFGEDDPELLTFSSYSSLNEVEKNGLDGILDCVSILGTSGANYEQMKLKAAELEQAFVKMGVDSSHNSQIARAVYLSEAHHYFKNLAATYEVMGTTYILVDNNNHPYNPVNELSKDNEEENNIYSDSFSFAEYGHRTKAFLDEAHPIIYS